MQTIIVETTILAPAERCFLLSLSIDLHVESTTQTGERAIAGVTHGIIGPGERVTWRGRHFGLMLTHESIISGYRRSVFFEDTMLRGMFHTFAHKHYFEEHIVDAQPTTFMRDELTFSAPLGPLGLLAEQLLLRGYLQRFLIERNSLIRAVAEGPAYVWQRYLIQDDSLNSRES